jgi:protein-tyrosine phosphatase
MSSRRDGGAPVRVLMVCMGNICRSPTAEAMLRKLAAEEGMPFVEIDSAGTHDYHVGAAPDRRAVAHGRAHGLEMAALRGRQVEAADFTRFDFLLAMDRDNLEGLERRRPPGATAQVALLLSFAPAIGADEVPDPYYGTEDGFERVIALVEAGCRGFLRYVRSARGGNLDQNGRLLV